MVMGSGSIPIQRAPEAVSAKRCKWEIGTRHCLMFPGWALGEDNGACIKDPFTPYYKCKGTEHGTPLNNALHCSTTPAVQPFWIGIVHYSSNYSYLHVRRKLSHFKELEVFWEEKYSIKVLQ